MLLFDARLRGAGIRAIDLENLAFFGVAGVVITPPTGRPAAGPEEVLARFDAILGPDRARVQAAGMQAFCVLGVHPSWAPPRGMHKVLHRMPEYLCRPGVVGVGEIGLKDGTPPELDLLERHLELAEAHDLPVVIHLAAADRVRLTSLVLDRLLNSRFPLDRVLVAQVGPDTLELVKAAGVRVGVSVGAEPVARAAAVQLLQEHGPDGVIVDGGVGEGAADLLSMPKAAEELAAGGWSVDEVQRVFRDNAAGFFGVSVAPGPVPTP